MLSVLDVVEYVLVELTVVEELDVVMVDEVVVGAVSHRPKANPIQLLFAAGVLLVQVSPSGDVSTAELAIMTKFP